MGVKYKPNNIYNVDSYKLIKQIPDKSIDCIYVDIPYFYGGTTNNLDDRAIHKTFKR